MKRTLSLLLAILTLLTASACASSTVQENNPTDSSVLTLTSNEETKEPASASIDEPTDKTSDTSVDTDTVSGASDETSATSSASSDSSTSSDTAYTGKADSSLSGGTDKKTEPAKTPETTNTPETSKTPETGKSQGSSDAPSNPPAETEKPKDTTPKTEPPAETTKPQKPEPPAPTEPEKPSTPKTAYDYEFDIDQIRRDLIALGKGYGLTLDESLNPNNASWANPVFATKSTQGNQLKRLLFDSVQYYADAAYRTSMGLPDLGLSHFNIYCESLGNGEYRIYFLNY